MTDLYPNLSTWQRRAKGRKNLKYVQRPVDATDTPKVEELLDGVVESSVSKKRKVSHLFFACFHNFDDPLTAKMFQNTTDTADGYAIVELQHRRPFDLFVYVLLIEILTPLLTLVESWKSWRELLITFLFPVMPLFFIRDGTVICLGCRLPFEVIDSLKTPAEKWTGAHGKAWEGGSFKSATDTPVFPPVANANILIGMKDE